MIALRLRARTKWVALLVYLLTASLGYGGLSLCVAADGDFGEGYEYCCRYWCDAAPPLPEGAHFVGCASSPAGLDAGSGDIYSCRDYSLLVLPRGRNLEVRHASSMKSFDGLPPAERVVNGLRHEAAYAAPLPWLDQIFHPITHEPLSVILLL